MSRIFITGDKHGLFFGLKEKLDFVQSTKDDCVIICGDHGTLYFGDDEDRYKKNLLQSFPATFIMLKGNHDRRPSDKEYHHTLKRISTKDIEGTFWVDPLFPNLLYTLEYGWYRFGTKKVFIIGGAYSVDKDVRLKLNKAGYTSYLWFPDEQLNQEERIAALQLLKTKADGEYYLMTHTCPNKYKPLDTFSSHINQKTVDSTMEKFLDEIESNFDYKKWYCGHFHIDRNIDKISFVYDGLLLFDEVE